MNLFALTHKKIISALDGLVPDTLDTSKVAVDHPRNSRHGHVATNAAMVLAKPTGMEPRELANQLAKRLQDWAWLEDAQIAGPGFINIRFKDIVWHEVLKSIDKAGEEYGHSDLGKGQRINVEYVSANPTGPLHMGHARGAIVGDALARTLAAVGFDVTREFYMNDSGAQVDILAQSLHLRYRQLFGEVVDIPDGCYPGEYLIEVAQALKERDGDKWLGIDDWKDSLKRFAISYLINEIRLDLDRLSISQIFSSEADLIAKGQVDLCLKDLDEKGLLYRGILEPPKGKTA